MFISRRPSIWKANTRGFWFNHHRLSYFTPDHRVCLYFKRTNPRSKRWLSFEIQWDNNRDYNMNARIPGEVHIGRTQVFF